MTDLALLALPAATLADDGAGSFLIVGLWVFLLAIFVGVELITKVPPTLHTPLMSGANAISGITLVGALSCAAADFPQAGRVLGFLAITLATINVVGGFLVTDRMLGMFGSSGRGKKDAD
ncbi:MAG: NAD(P) transhydrogenase subunit alpha [Planctomycetes bacterium]|jgi:NAD(P) transhydrogenase subunit alpha|nr:NAD(P) transhydrogenase subunit alpha [Planctomycetota bacterium]MDP6408214.1 NAD(P) transhydrogenase subunit alpha [Planctomycetota bacterium]